jgi:hypothetical protein
MLLSRHHGDAFHGARIHANAAPVAFFPVYLKRLARRVPCSEVAHSGANSAVDARPGIGRFDELALIAGLMEPRKVAAAVIAAEADAVDLFIILRIPERPRYQMLFPGLLEYGIDFLSRYRMLAGAFGGRTGGELEAHVHAGALTGASMFPAVTVGNPVLFMAFDDRFCLIQRAYEVESQAFGTHRIKIGYQSI